jgi:hypothetical protein
MARVAFEVPTKLSPDQVMSMLVDFSPRRPELWPTLARELYCVHKIATTSADVQEGSRWPTLMWERDHYDWSMAGRVRWTVQAGNYSKPGSYVQAIVQEAAVGGSRVLVEWNQTGIGLKGKALIALVVLTRGANIRRKVFERAFARAMRRAG